MLPSSPFAGTTQNANLLAIVFGLESTGATTTPPPGDNTLLYVGIGIAILAVVVVIVLYMRRSE